MACPGPAVRFQIRGPFYHMRALNLFLLTAIAVSLLLLGSSCSRSVANGNNSNTAESENQPVTVKTAVAKVEQIPTYFEATGTLASDAESNVAPTMILASASTS